MEKYSKSTEPFLWVACELSNSRLKFINFIAILKITIFNILSKFSKNCSKFDRRLLSSQTSPRKIFSWGFQKVQNHLCRWTESEVIGNLIIPINSDSKHPRSKFLARSEEKLKLVKTSKLWSHFSTWRSG